MGNFVVGMAAKLPCRNEVIPAGARHASPLGLSGLSGRLS